MVKFSLIIISLRTILIFSVLLLITNPCDIIKGSSLYLFFSKFCIRFNNARYLFKYLSISIVFLFLFFISYTSLIFFIKTSKKDLEYLNKYNLAINSSMKSFLSSKLINSSKSVCFVTINKFGLYFIKSSFKKFKYSLVIFISLILFIISIENLKIS